MWEWGKGKKDNRELTTLVNVEVSYQLCFCERTSVRLRRGFCASVTQEYTAAPSYWRKLAALLNRTNVWLNILYWNRSSLDLNQGAMKGGEGFCSLAAEKQRCHTHTHTTSADIGLFCVDSGNIIEITINNSWNFSTKCHQQTRLKDTELFSFVVSWLEQYIWWNNK